MGVPARLRGTHADDDVALRDGSAAGSQQAQPPVAPAPTIRADFNAAAPDARQQGREPGRPIIEERPHTVGLGSALTASNRGIGGATRVFFNDRIGVDFSANWYRPNSRYSTGYIFHATPSFLYMLTKPNDLRDVDIRPYVGGGLSYINSTYRSTVAPNPLNQRTSGLGGQAFGGAEAHVQGGAVGDDQLRGPVLPPAGQLREHEHDRGNELPDDVPLFCQLTKSRFRVHGSGFSFAVLVRRSTFTRF